MFQSATQIASAIRQGEISSSEVLARHLDQIGKHNPALNAIVTLDAERARIRAQEADAAAARREFWGPLHGVPVTIKDSLETAGLRTTSSFKPLSDYIPKRDATVVARLRKAGAVILGKTNMPMLAMEGQTNSPIFGRANNPWDITRTPGGSTGGGAAAVAAGMSPLEIGSDIAGSVRIPAHYCGVYSLKPTEHRVPLTGHIPELPGSPRGVRHMAVIGPLARSVSDLRLALELMAGPDGRDKEMPPVALEPVDMRELRDYRFLWSDDFGGVPVTAETKEAIAELVGLLKDSGCQVEKCNPPNFDFEGAWYTWGHIFGAEVGVTMPAIARLISTHKFRRSGKNFSAARGVAHGMRLDMQRYVDVLTRRDGFINQLDEFLAGWDGWLCPVTATPAITHRKSGTPIQLNGGEISLQMGQLAYTNIFNLTGHPVVSMPVALSDQGLPISLQLVGSRWQEMALLNVAEALTDLTGPAPHPPGYDHSPAQMPDFLSLSSQIQSGIGQKQ